MPEANILKFEKIIIAPEDLIYRAFTSASALREWLCDISTTVIEEGGRIYLAWNHGYFASGHFNKLVPNQAVSFTWIGKEEPGWTQVNVSITKLAEDNQCLVSLVHEDIGTGALWENARKEITKGWQLGFENLKSTLETGRDLRITNRPLIGIYPDDLSNIDLETRKSWNLPVDNGVVVTEVLPNYGAENAGIQQNDVIVAIDGKKVDRIRTLGTIINEYSAGDRISVEIFRGDERLTYAIDTMPRIIEHLPDTAEKLAKDLEVQSSEVLELIENVLAGVLDAEASYSPGEEEWSAKEVLVHLIHSERDLHSWINDLASGQERFYDEWPGDSLFRIRATLASYPKIDDLLTELRRSLKETVASVAFLSQDFTRRKASYWRLGTELQGRNTHFKEHIQQIENNIKMSRSKNPF
ncbi:MAG: SRPBCC domain-containing protein [Anaerolineales bacterium]